MPPSRHDEPVPLQAAQADSSSSDLHSGSETVKGKTKRRTRRVESLQTQTKILDAAETLFMDSGFTATSFRAIARNAGVNLAAAHYHFGSKEGLFAATLHRRVAPLTANRLKALADLEARTESPTAREILNAYLRPLASLDPDSPLPRLIARLYGEPHSISDPIVRQEFGETAGLFLKAVIRAFPDVPEDIMTWRFHFVIGSMIHLLSFDSPPIVVSAEPEPLEGLESLIDFAVSGLEAPTRRGSESSAPGEPKDGGKP